MNPSQLLNEYRGAQRTRDPSFMHRWRQSLTPYDRGRLDRMLADEAEEPSEQPATPLTVFGAAYQQALISHVLQQSPIFQMVTRSRPSDSIVRLPNIPAKRQVTTHPWLPSPEPEPGPATKITISQYLSYVTQPYDPIVDAAERAAAAQARLNQLLNWSPPWWKTPPKTLRYVLKNGPVDDSEPKWWTGLRQPWYQRR